MDELNPDERVALEAWHGETPPAGFADRVVAAANGTRAPRRRGRAAASFLAGALAAAAVTFVAMRPDAPALRASGTRTAIAREEIALGRRGVAVAEAGAALTWNIADDGAARVEQRAGDVFYRVEPGGPFVVATPAGDVRVTGTCFRVEVQMKPSKSSLTGAALGAALAAAVVVTVYEGGVVVADAGGGGDMKVAAGEQAVIGRERTPALIAATQPPPTDATREQLLARDATQRQAIAQLEARLAGLENQPAAGGVRATASGVPYFAQDDGDGRPWFDPSPELLAEFVEDCRIRFDTPSLHGSEPREISAAMGAEVGLDAKEVDAVNAALRDLHARWRATLIGLYVEATGDTQEHAESMSPLALEQEIQDKAAPDELAQVRERIARERAGLVAPPTDLSQASPAERYLRGMTRLGDDLEAALGRTIGADRARALRALEDGWGSQHVLAGCADRR